MKRILLYLLVLFALPAAAQQIIYSKPESGDLRSLDFEVIGKVQNNYLIYKHLRNNYDISVYNDDMEQTDKVPLQILPDKTLQVDFIAYPDYVWMVYQFQKRNIIHCMAAKINGDGKLLADPIELDTTSINFLADNKIYSTIASEDKSKIMVFKVQKKNDRFNFTTLLFNDKLELQKKSRITEYYDDKKNVFSDFILTNNGNFVFSKGDRSNSRDFIRELFMVTKAPEADSFAITAVPLGDNMVDEIKLKVDNLNQHYIINSFYYAKRKGNVEGLYTAVMNITDNKLVSINRINFGNSIRETVKEKGANKAAFNDFFIRDIILKKDGGFILTAEDFYTQSRSNPWNRWDYLYGYPSFYSPYYYNYYSPYYGYGNRYYDFNSQTRYYYNNVLVVSIDEQGKYQWSNVIHKSQFDEGNDNYLSYALMLTGGQLHFLFNEMERRQRLISDQSVTPDGKVNRNPPLRSLDRGYEFMPRYARQVAANEIIVPCSYRNYICFAKIEF